MGSFRSKMTDKGKGTKAEVAPRHISFTPHKVAFGHIFQTLILAMALLPAYLTFTSSAIEKHLVTSSRQFSKDPGISTGEQTAMHHVVFSKTFQEHLYVAHKTQLMSL